MRRAILFCALLCAPLLVTTSGCNKQVSATTPPAAVAPGYNNLTDQQIGQIIAGATAFYNHVQADVQAGKYTPSATELTALNSFGVTLNGAKTVYGAYHAGQATLAQAQAAANQVTTQQTELQAVVTGGK